MNITKKELEIMYNSNTNDYCCKQLGVTKVTLVKYLTQCGIKLKGKSGGKKKKLNIIQEIK